MATKLVASAEYFTLSDFVEVAVYYGDATTLYPESVKTGTVKLLHNKAPIASAEFDMFGGNADGSFRIFFMHPSTIKNLSVKVTMETVDGEEFTAKAKVRTVKQDMGALTTAPAKGDIDREDYDGESQY